MRDGVLWLTKPAWPRHVRALFSLSRIRRRRLFHVAVAARRPDAAHETWRLRVGPWRRRPHVRQACSATLPRSLFGVTFVWAIFDGPAFPPTTAREDRSRAHSGGSFTTSPSVMKRRSEPRKGGYGGKPGSLCLFTVVANGALAPFLIPHHANARPEHKCRGNAAKAAGQSIAARASRTAVQA